MIVKYLYKLKLDKFIKSISLLMVDFYLYDVRYNIRIINIKDQKRTLIECNST